jgi:DNA-binding transcriptional LysR family regulator
LNLERLRVLHAVSTTGSVRGAADTLHVTTSAVSQQLARLEREIGQPLLERQGRGIRLTEAGSVLADHAGGLLAQVERVEADLAGRRGAVAGRLRVAAFATAARGLLPDAMRALRADHPGLAVRLAELEPTLAIPALRRADVDVAIVQDWPDARLAVPDSLSRRCLLEDILDVALPADHPLAARDRLGWADLAGEDWVSWTSGQLCHDWLRQILAGHGVEPEITHTASEHSTQLALVAAGLGAAVIPRLGREPVPETVRIIAVEPVPSRQVYALWRTSAARRPAVRAVVQALHEAARRREPSPGEPSRGGAVLPGAVLPGAVPAGAVVPAATATRPGGPG